jgi:hypothetical protein
MKYLKFLSLVIVQIPSAGESSLRVPMLAKVTVT